jgi:tetratricopeptide (TPR) repeat protein
MRSIPEIAWEWLKIIIRVLIFIAMLAVARYLYVEVTRDALIVDPFDAPKILQDRGLYGDVVASRIGDAIRRIEEQTRTKMKKDSVAQKRDVDSMPIEEVHVGGVFTAEPVRLLQALFKRPVRHIEGDIVLDTSPSPNPESRIARITIYVSHGWNPSQPATVEGLLGDLNSLIQRAAEEALRQANPYVLAVYRRQTQQYEQSIELARVIIRDPDQGPVQRSAAYNLLGNVNNDQRNWKEAKANYQKAIELNPSNVKAYNNWGNVLGIEGRFEEAIAKHQMATRLDPKDPQSYVGWGAALAEKEKFDDAIAKFREALKLDPSYSVAQLSLGMAVLGKGKLEDAIIELDKAIELDPKNSKAYLYLGLALRKQQDYKKAIAMFQKAIDLDPRNQTASEELAKTRRYQGETNEIEIKRPTIRRHSVPAH